MWKETEDEKQKQTTNKASTQLQIGTTIRVITVLR